MHVTVFAWTIKYVATSNFKDTAVPKLKNVFVGGPYQRQEFTTM